MAISSITANRSEISWRPTSISNKIIAFHVYFLTKLARPNGKTLSQIANDYDFNYGQPLPSLLERFQKTIFEIQNIEDFNTFFKFIGMPQTPEQITNLLIKSVKSSERKGYHKNRNIYK